MAERKKFVCKYCDKKYSCGKSLGGHIKTHMTNELYSSSQSKEGRIKTNADDRFVVKFDGGRKKKRDFGSEEAASGNPILHGLRENPKKTTRFVHSNVVAAQPERFCKECGKGFLSVKALCGHMACHSEKDKGTMTNKFGFSMKQKLLVDSESDTETSAPNHPRRYRRMRFKTVNTDKNDHPSFFSSANGSSSLSEVEQEQEEVARCLMLLSKDFSHRGRFVLPTESSNNNSIVAEAKSPSMDTIITFKNGKKSSLPNGFEIMKEKEKKVVQYNNNMKLKSTDIVDSDNSDSGYLRNGPKNIGFSIDGYPRIGEFKTPKVELRSGCEFHQNHAAESRKKMLIKNRGRTSRSTEPRKLIFEDFDCNTTDRATREEFINWRKRPRYDSLCQNNSVGVSHKRTPNGFHNERSLKPEKSLNSEKIINGSQDSAEESDESITDSDAYTGERPHSSKFINGKKTGKLKKKLKSKKSRDHDCPICNKSFKSGQALGGHERSHFIGGSEENTVVIRQGPPVVPCLIDLNLPAPVDD